MFLYALRREVLGNATSWLGYGTTAMHSFYTPFGVRCLGTLHVSGVSEPPDMFLYALRREVLGNRLNGLPRVVLTGFLYALRREVLGNS